MARMRPPAPLPPVLRDRAFRIETSDPLGPEMFAGDGFHPSPILHAAFADAVMAGLAAPG